MNDFANTKDTGLLKDSYGDSGLLDALKKKREKLAKSRLSLGTDDEKENDEGERENG